MNSGMGMKSEENFLTHSKLTFQLFIHVLCVHKNLVKMFRYPVDFFLVKNKINSVSEKCLRMF